MVTTVEKIARAYQAVRAQTMEIVEPLEIEDYVVQTSDFEEYNDKWMVGRKVLRGGSFATPRGHIRATYRSFFTHTSAGWSQVSAAPGPSDSGQWSVASGH